MIGFSKAGETIRKGYNRFEKWRKYANSRKQADLFRKKVTERKGFSVLNSKLNRQIRMYAASRFGDESYWHWLALYTEIRGEFVEGWTPDDYYTFEWLPSLNSQIDSGLSLIKSFDHRLFPDHTVQPLLLRINGAFYKPGHEKISTVECYNLLDQFDSEVVIKQDCGPSGKGLIFKPSRKVTENDFNDSYNYVIQPAVEQHHEMNKLSASSVNTIRVVTLLEPGGDVYPFFTSLKFGVGDSKVDNVNMGGRFLLLDADGVVRSNPHDELGLECSTCIASGFKYKGLRVPSYRRAVEVCKEQHVKFPYTRFIAWDIYIDKQSSPKIIEWNARLPGMWVNEAVAGPLWAKRQSDEKRMAMEFAV